MNYRLCASKALKRFVRRTPVPDLLLKWGLYAKKTEELPSPQEALEALEVISPRPKPAFREFAFEESPDVDLTVIVPVYNTEKYVGECLDSILAQKTTFSMELVVVNDGSTDGSLDVIRQHVRGDSRARLIDQPNMGFSGARNVAIDHARGESLCFVDSDDVLADGHLQRLWDAWKDRENSFVSGLYSKMSEDGRILGLGERARTHGGPWSRLYSRDQWEKVRFPEGFWFEDTVIAYCIKSRYLECFSTDAGYCRRLRGNSITMTHRTSPKAVDGFWIVAEMLDWCRRLDIPLDCVYRQTIIQFGALLFDRCGRFDESSLRALFVACSELIASTPEWHGLQNSLDGRLGYLEQSLWCRDFSLWVECCKWL